MRPKGLIDFDYSQLDPGIRRLVRWLHDNGYKTTDSGDGVTKFKRRDELRERVLDGDYLDATSAAAELDDAIDACNCAIEAPNVVIACPKSRLVAVADELQELLASVGIKCPPLSEDGGDPNIQASYDPGNGIASILLTYVDDGMLPDWIGGER